MFEERKINPNLQKQYREQGYWKDETLLDCWDRTVETYPEREYVVDDRGNRYTYRELDEAAGRVASYLIGLGIQPGEVVSFQLPIWSEFAMLTIACYKVGAVAHPIAMSYEEKELARSLNHKVDAFRRCADYPYITYGYCHFTILSNLHSRFLTLIVFQILDCLIDHLFCYKIRCMGHFLVCHCCFKDIL